MFYGHESYFKSYNDDDAKIFRWVQDLKSGIFGEDHFIDVIKPESESLCGEDKPKNKDLMVVLTCEHVVILNAGSRDVIDHFKMDHLKNVTQVSDSDLVLEVSEYFAVRIFPI